MVYGLLSIVFINVSFAVDPSYFSTAESIVITSPTPLITFGYIMQLIFSLLVVVGFIFIVAKYVLPKIKTSTKGNFISVVDRVVLEPQVSSYILKVRDAAWLIVVSNKNVTKIDKLEGNF